MRFANDTTPVWVKHAARWDSYYGDIPEWEEEAMHWPDEAHPSGKEGLVRVSYLYRPFSGWIRADRIRHRGIGSKPIQELS